MVVLSWYGKIVELQPTNRVAENQWAENPLVKELYGQKKLVPGLIERGLKMITRTNDEVVLELLMSSNPQSSFALVFLFGSMASMVNPSDSTIPANNTNHLVQFNPSSQLPLELTGPMNFVIWKAQVESLMFGHDLYYYLDRTLTTPSKIVSLTNQQVANPKYKLWFYQDQLIHNALMVSADPTITSAIAKTSTSKQA
ncbi:hypothetical protein P3L10_014353 [Capsicum annuum]